MGAKEYNYCRGFDGWSVIRQSDFLTTHPLKIHIIVFSYPVKMVSALEN